MSHQQSRRDFLKAGSAAALGAGLADSSFPAELPGHGSSEVPSPAPAAIKKGVLLGMLPKNLSYADRLKMARDLGFEAIQAYTTPDQHEAEEIKKAAEGAGIRIDSVMNQAHWEYPLSSDDPAVVQKSLDGVKTSLHSAKFWGSYSVLLVPAVVNEKTSYQQAWERSQKQIRTLIPLAQELSVVIAIEEVWNKFLLSPLEFARYIDEFNRPWIKAW